MRVGETVNRPGCSIEIPGGDGESGGSAGVSIPPGGDNSPAGGVGQSGMAMSRPLGRSCCNLLFGHHHYSSHAEIAVVACCLLALVLGGDTFLKSVMSRDNTTVSDFNVVGCLIGIFFILIGVMCMCLHALCAHKHSVQYSLSSRDTDPRSPDDGGDREPRADIEIAY